MAYQMVATVVTLNDLN